jgi:uncharacterized protein (TIGR00251 family)
VTALGFRTEKGPLSLPCKKCKDGVTFEVRVQPRASRLGIEGVAGGVLRVKLTAPPAGGEANEQLVKLLADELGVRKSSVRILRGRASRNKGVEVTGLGAEEEA